MILGPGAELRDEKKTCVTGLQTRVVARDPVAKEVCLEGSDSDRSSRDKFIAMTSGCFDQSRMEFYRCPAREVGCPIHEEG